MENSIGIIGMIAIQFQAGLHDEVETAMYRILQETLTSIARHANAHSASIPVEAGVRLSSPLWKMTE